VKIGQSIKIGYFKQEIDDLKDTMSVIGAVKEISEYINVGVGRERYLTPRDLLDKFLFPRSQHSALISTLSGGERKRLALIRVLMSNPNVLLLDEPTNDFDMQTLNAFEEYLDDFMGVLIIVSHDRSFLDRTVEFIYAFDGLGNIKQYPGNYSYYLEQKEQNKRSNGEQSTRGEEYKKSRVKVKTKLSYHDQREYDELENLIPKLEKEHSELEQKIYSGEESDYIRLQEMSNLLHELSERIESASNRWLELADSID
jgi:ATP-binding cassette subfamily F protein uup